MPVVHPGSALGEAVGKLIEDQIRQAVVEVSQPLSFRVSSSRLRNSLHNRHQIDIVISDGHGNPIILIEPKYLRYTKHNWDKGSRLCIAFHSLRRTHSSIRKTIAVLAGNWTDTSLAFIRSFGIEVYMIRFDHIVDVMAEYGVHFEWEERDDVAPGEAWATYQGLSTSEKNQIAQKLTQDVKPRVAQSVEDTLRQPELRHRRVASLELTVITDQNEVLVKSFPSVREMIQSLLDFQVEREDISDLLR